MSALSNGTWKKYLEGHCTGDSSQVSRRQQGCRPACGSSQFWGHEKKKFMYIYTCCHLQGVRDPRLRTTDTDDREKWYS
jgi:hypothetical protein